MRVCHIISGDQWAGAEVMDYRLLQGLGKYNDLELSAILLNEGKVAEEFRKLGITVFVAPETGNGFFRLIEIVGRMAKQFSPDIMHSHRLKENLLAYHSAKNMGHTRLICTQHGMPEPLSGKMKVLKRFLLSKYHLTILSRHFRKIVAVSEDIRCRFILEYGFGEEKIGMIRNGTDIPSCFRTKEDGGPFVIGSAGRLFPVKDYPFMVEIAREISQRAGDIRFELAGEGPERESILGSIREYGLEKIFFLSGFIDDIPKFYERLDLYMNTSVHEGIPMSVLEAMAHGMPVIAPNTGGLKEIIEDGLQGFLIDGRDPRKYADACMKLYGDRKLLNAMGAAARRKIEREFSFDKMAARYYEMYKTI